jgi:hypothetical protein
MIFQSFSLDPFCSFSNKGNHLDIYIFLLIIGYFNSFPLNPPCMKKGGGQAGKLTICYDPTAWSFSMGL